MAVVEWTNNWTDAERWWIQALREKGCRLVNGNDGGTDMGHIRQKNYAAIGRLYRHIDGLISAVQLALGNDAPEVSKARQLAESTKDLIEGVKGKGEDVLRDFDDGLALKDGW